MKVLVSAYACDPAAGSEGGIGWRWVREIAARHRCWLITRENNVEAVEAAARAAGIADLCVVGYDLPRWARWWKRGGRGALAYFHLWQLGVARLARRLDAEHDVDVVHHLTFASSWVHAGLARVGKPFVWGPLGRHPRVPAAYLAGGLSPARWFEPLKELVRTACARLSPFARATQQAADVLLAIEPEALRDLPREARARAVTMLAAGTDLPRLEAARWERAHPFRVLFVGRLVDLKGVRLALEAFGVLHDEVPGAELHLVGSGPCAPALRRRADQLGLSQALHLHGALPHAQALAHMERADVFLFPSFEGAGMVVLEAMARGCPVVCLDRGGPAHVVSHATGIRVPLAPGFRETALRLGAALASLVRDEEHRRSLARNARAWAAEHATWEHKGERLGWLYARAVRVHGSRSGGSGPPGDTAPAAGAEERAA